MKTRESGMPEEAVWAGFFKPEETLRKLGLARGCGDAADFGCGYGTFAVPAARIVRGVVHAFDVDPDMAARTNARARAEGLDNVRASARDLTVDGCGLPDGGVDFVMVFNLVHCEDPVPLLKEARRALSSGGILALIHWNHDASTPRGPSLEIRPRPEQCRVWAVEAGFVPRESGVVDLPPYHYGLSFQCSPADCSARP